MRVGVDTPRLEQKKDSHTEGEKWSLLFRHLMWFRKVKSFHESVSVRFSPGSIVDISCQTRGRVRTRVLFEEDRGSRSHTGTFHSLLWYLCMKHLVVVGLFNGCFRMFTISLELSRRSRSRRRQQSRIYANQVFFSSSFFDRY
jgi:hypothetical protein